ncbi:UNKNOWN [Stylonychia lemnae]|uniref:Ion transport domain-containing protein n=1 Tax=Stylonychia lemnae TaxID=5949 RepID=A0A078ART8_STYLE|nr:UNKNOWN [Stylonychia lemnae]|eukprot:CDW83593.1 UNKNOWN [Stylonychia lemnae]
MIFEVVSDMRYFFIVLLVTIIAFGDSFLKIANANPDQEKRFTSGFIDSIIYTYKMILGDFDTDEFGDVAPALMMILFLLCTVFNMIVMLNLLIAIISESFARVTGMSDQAVYQEMASMISENSYLVPDLRMKTYCAQHKYILLVNNLETMEDSVNEQEMLKNLENRFINEISIIKEDLVSLKSAIEKIIRVTQTMNSKFGQIKLMMLEQPVKEVKVKISKMPLTLTTLHQLKEKYKNGGYNDGVVCKGNQFVGCKNSDKIGNDHNEVIHHCPQCNFELCQKCFELIENIHEHPLEKFTYGHLLETQNDSYGGGWQCDCRYFQGCVLDGKAIKDPYEIVYHDSKNQFNLCVSCANSYKV